MKPSRHDADLLISAATSAYRARDRDGHLLADPAWLDLDAARRATARLRTIEATLDPGGLSSMAKAVLARLRR